MKRKIASLLLTAVMMCVMAVPAFAADKEYSVTYDGEKLNSSYTSSEIDEMMEDMQPGDEVTVTINLKNNSDVATSWYIANEIIQSMEEGDEEYGGVYTYVLTYSGPGGTVNIYNSNGEDEDNLGVGGQGTNGLEDATEGRELDDYFYLDKLDAGASATVTLTVGLDGATMNNSYQDQLAKLALKFAVEEETETTTRTVVTSVKTGDFMKTAPFIVLCAVSGGALLGFAVVGLQKKKHSGEAEK